MKVSKPKCVVESTETKVDLDLNIEVPEVNKTPAPLPKDILQKVQAIHDTWLDAGGDTNSPTPIKDNDQPVLDKFPTNYYSDDDIAEVGPFYDAISPPEDLITTATEDISIDHSCSESFDIEDESVPTQPEIESKQTGFNLLYHY